jgi:hypothetical protein
MKRTPGAELRQTIPSHPGESPRHKLTPQGFSLQLLQLVGTAYTECDGKVTLMGFTRGAELGQTIPPHTTPPNTRTRNLNYKRVRY